MASGVRAFSKRQRHATDGGLKSDGHLRFNVMLLLIRPEHTSDLERAESLWRQFESALSPRPFNYSRVEFRALEPEKSGLFIIPATVNAVASAGLEVGDHWERAEIRLGERFFVEGRTENQQTLTLLHELIHLRYSCGVLREQYLTTAKKEQLAQPDFWADDFLFERCDIAGQILKFVDEIIVELHQLRYYPHLARSDYYTEMRRSAFLGQHHMRVSASLRQYAAVLELLRHGLGLMISESGSSNVVALESYVVAIEKDLRSLVSAGEAGRLLKLRDTMLHVQLEPLEFDQGPFDALFDEVMAVGQPL
jgi:hypothetical protein